MKNAVAWSLVGLVKMELSRSNPLHSTQPAQWSECSWYQ